MKFVAGEDERARCAGTAAARASAKPSAICARSASPSSRSRSSWNGVRIASSDASEKTYETTSATNGSDAAEPEERAAERTARRASRSHSAPAPRQRRRAAGALATTERSAPTSAMLKKTNAVPSTNATTAICANVRWCEGERDDEAADREHAYAVGGEHHALAVPRGRRRHRRRGRRAHTATMFAKPTTPACAGECVSARTSSG